MQFTLFCWHCSLPFLRPLVNFWCCFFSCRSVLVILHQRQQVYEARVHDGWTYRVCCRNSHKHSRQESWKLLSASLLICGMWLEQARPYPRSCHEYRIHDTPLFLWTSDLRRHHQMQASWPDIELRSSRAFVSLNNGKYNRLHHGKINWWLRDNLNCFACSMHTAPKLYGFHGHGCYSTSGACVSMMCYTACKNMLWTLDKGLCAHLSELLWPCSGSVVCHCPHDRDWHTHWMQ